MKNGSVDRRNAEVVLTDVPAYKINCIENKLQLKALHLGNVTDRSDNNESRQRRKNPIFMTLNKYRNAHDKQQKRPNESDWKTNRKGEEMRT